jgi:hypothetical protein
MAEYLTEQSLASFASRSATYSSVRIVSFAILDEDALKICQNEREKSSTFGTYMGEQPTKRRRLGLSLGLAGCDADALIDCLSLNPMFSRWGNRHPANPFGVASKHAGGTT